MSYVMYAVQDKYITKNNSMYYNYIHNPTTQQHVINIIYNQYINKQTKNR